MFIVLCTLSLACCDG